MTLVVDASAIGAVVFGEPNGTTIAAHIEDESLVAPTLIDYAAGEHCLERRSAVIRRSAFKSSRPSAPCTVCGSSACRCR